MIARALPERTNPPCTRLRLAGRSQAPVDPGGDRDGGRLDDFCRGVDAFAAGHGSHFAVLRTRGSHCHSARRLAVFAEHGWPPFDLPGGDVVSVFDAAKGYGVRAVKKDLDFAFVMGRIGD
ncbi:hypothetical protein [Candidatus Accumulibacter sp. ACC003]|uniref:hypothetical protein n=1 Tax=Candidatus Accumulibacter sp. ACC003 TaxID=2823334 RepID=UPI0025BD6CC3|nr:hypothetical protein [Candidatus Accumulibacter sp. ACC003]